MHTFELAWENTLELARENTLELTREKVACVGLSTPSGPARPEMRLWKRFCAREPQHSSQLEAWGQAAKVRGV
jgi:hypothetical protein